MHVLDGATRELKTQLEVVHLEDSLLPKVKFLIPHTLQSSTADKVKSSMGHWLAFLKASKAKNLTTIKPSHRR